MLLAIALFCGNANAQQWLDPNIQNNPNPNYFEMRDAFQNYWQGKKIEKGKGYKAFQRWLHFWETRVDENGNFPDRSIILKNSDRDAGKSAQRSMVANWTNLGPNSSDGGYAGIGRINCIGFHPTDANTIWVGSPGGGLWKTTNGGSTWTTNSDDFPVLGVSSILVHPTDPNIMYIATGDGDGWDTYSVGVLKSTDGGVTWATTGLNWTNTFNNVIRKLMFDRNDANTILAATSNGIWRTTNAGTNWTQESTGDYHDIEAKPDATASTMYATRGNEIRISTNDGDTWTTTETISGAGRIALAVTVANTAHVVALCGSSATSGFLSLLRSTNSGVDFSTQSTSPNLLGWSEVGDDTGGQAWYDLVVAVSPANADEIYVGGVNTWKSTNGGVNWTLNSHWYQIAGVAAVHADKHAMEWQNSTTLFQGNDGGVYKTSNGGTAWTDISNGLVISQMYRLGTSQTDTKCITGLQDNGTKLRSTAGVWSDHIGGDGMECAINPTNSNIMYATLYYGEIFRSSNNGGSWTNIQDNITSNPEGAWITPFILAPGTPTTIYAGYEDVFKTTNSGTSWTQISTNLTGGSTDLQTLAAAPSNANYLYAATHWAIYRTTNGGTSWSTMTFPGDGALTSLVVSPTDANTIWATKSNYTAGNKVWKSTDGGTTWTNVSGSLPNLPVNTIVYQNGTADGLYVGTDNGVYYRDNNIGDWQAYDTGLPNVEVFELEINYGTSKLRAATYGRGLWESDLFSGSYISLTPASQNVGSSAGGITINISSNVAWTASDDATWLTITPTSGSNNGVLNCTFTANTASAPRTATVTVTNGTISNTATITQDGNVSGLCSNGNEPANNTTTGAPTATLSKEYLSQIGSTTDVDHFKFVVTGTVPVPVRLRLYSLPGDYDLFLLNSGGGQLAASERGGTTPEDILYTANPGTYYAKIIGYNGANSTSDCYNFAVEKQTRALYAYPTTITVPGGTTKSQFEITTNCQWSATVDPADSSWLHLLNPSGNGDADLQFEAFLNFSSATRTGNIVVSGCGLTKNLTVKQLVADACSNGGEPANNTSAGAQSLTTNYVRYSQIGTAGDVDYYKFQMSATVATPMHLFMTNLPGDYELFLEDGSGNVLASSENSGTNDEEINYTLPPGFHYLRVIGYNGAFSNSQCYHLTLTKSTKVLKAYPTINTVESLAGSTPFSVISNVSWTATPVESWLTLPASSGFGSGTMWVNFEQNTGTAARTGTVNMAGAGAVESVKVKQLSDPNLFNDPSDDRSEIVFEEKLAASENFEFVIYPNPTTGWATFETAFEGKTTVSVFDAFGRQVLRTEGENLIQLDLSRQPSGMYRVRMDNGGEVAFSNLVLMK